MQVTYLSHLGSDLDVVNAARVSFDKESKEFSTKDERLINYLATHNHVLPFRHVYFKFRVEAPIFVARQLVKHQVGLSWSEVSRRYVDTPPSFFIPTKWRKKAEDKKQGSSDEEITHVKIDPMHSVEVADYITRVNDLLSSAYHTLLDAGIAPEQARMILPQSTYTTWIWSGSFLAFINMCKLRCAPDAQQETKVIADQIFYALSFHMPISTKALLNVGN